MTSHSRTGAITVQASEVEVLGYNPTDTFLRPSAIATLLTAGTDNVSSPISIDAQQIRLQDGGRISTDVVNLARFGVEQSMTIGISGDISIRATESIEISGSTPFNLTSAIISSIQPVTQGQGGNISIETGRLSVSDGGGFPAPYRGVARQVIFGFASLRWR
uniref:Uncharacterized protein n=1 Tax=Desertifilum tharense IPPAS B-1220 TaxID=1781255 RepID=A0ACD5GMF5_9CYAN